MQLKPLLRLLFLLLHTGLAVAQKKACIVAAIPKNGYLYIPANAFEDSVDGVLSNNLIQNDTTKVVEIEWDAPEIDGDYQLVITPEQIYVRSSHDNPNPNKIYFAININPGQYTYFYRGVRGITNWDNWQPELKQLDTAVDNNNFQLHLVKILENLNNLLPRSEKKLILPRNLKAILSHGKYFYPSVERINDYTKIKRRVRVKAPKNFTAH